MRKKAQRAEQYGSMESPPIISLENARSAVRRAYCCPEKPWLAQLADYAMLPDTKMQHVADTAQAWITQLRTARQKKAGMDTFLAEYGLSSTEGIALMCLAESLLRVPDTATQDLLIHDKLGHIDWGAHIGQSPSWAINALTWGLLLTGRVVEKTPDLLAMQGSLRSLVQRSATRALRTVIQRAMYLVGHQFVMGETIEQAMGKATSRGRVRYSYDMLGEAALTLADAEHYYDAYRHAIVSVGQKIAGRSDRVFDKNGVSVKLSALYPKYQENYRVQAVAYVAARVQTLALLARQYDIPLTIDAEECDRLELSLDIFEQVFCDPALADWEGLGLAVQAYQKRAFVLLDWIYALAKQQQRRIMVRLVKGAYWDAEIKKAQVLGLPDYPVFTRKVYTDVSYAACAKKLLQRQDAIYAQFATHNAYTASLIAAMSEKGCDFEFQRLHGMGAAFYNTCSGDGFDTIPCRVYAPVGNYQTLLPYLVRRMLENGANTAFVHQLVDARIPVERLIASPVIRARAYLAENCDAIPLPSDIFMPSRRNAQGFDMRDRGLFESVYARVQSSHQQLRAAWGVMRHADDVSGEMVQEAIARGEGAFNAWASCAVAQRAQYIERYADLLETHRETLWAYLCAEAGKTWPDSIAEVREAVDFCRYYAEQARTLMGEPKILAGYTGERNVLSLHPRGLVLCISPWNFPLAIFTGQIVAALLCGNTVIAKPAEQTPRIAAFAIQLMHAAGIPEAVVQCVVGRGETVGAQLVATPFVKAVLFTGSLATAQLIHRNLSARSGEIVPLVAETGGMNAMLVDASALPEQVVQDVMQSAFGSAGQRCSALRVLYIQSDVYERIITMLIGAMELLETGEPLLPETDVGPVIDRDALDTLEQHVRQIALTGSVLYQCAVPLTDLHHCYMPPTLVSIDHISRLTEEVFGPVLHVIRYDRRDLDRVLEGLISTGYGLTLGIHSRNTHYIDYIFKKMPVGNVYVNRNMIGAVVGVQPFGGQGLSGTGPKAGGPYYLQRLCVEKVYTEDTTAAGGNAMLLMASEE